MNILKAYVNKQKCNIDFDSFVETNYCNIIIMNKTNREIKMKDGTKVLFRVFTNAETSYYQVAGYQFLYVDFIGDFDKDVMYYLKSRIR